MKRKTTKKSAPKSAKASAKRKIGRSVGASVLRVGLLVVAAITVASMIIIGSLRWIDPITSSILLQKNISGTPPVEQGSDQWASFDWQPLEKVSESMLLATVAAEDQRFLHHHGLDFVELSKALRDIANRPRGASTITQQVAKNLILWNGRSYLRKILEAGLAVYIDLTWGKRRVLEVYLNIVQFGPNIYGVENAAWYFFSKPAIALNRHEAARLAAVLPNPNHRSVANADDTVVRRQRWILQQMNRLGGEQFLEQLR